MRKVTQHFSASDPTVTASLRDGSCRAWKGMADAPGIT
jgi:hypothetical protein